MTKKVTIKDVAEHAEVGIGTVSRVLNGSTNVSQHTKSKILESIKKLNYVPNHIARSMRSQKYKNIAFFADISNPIFAQIAKESQLELEKHRYTLSLSNIGDKNIGDKIESFLEGRKFDGIILSIPKEEDFEINKLLSKIDIPIVTINRDIPVLPSGVLTDYYSSVKKAISYLISIGHKHIALVGGEKEIRPTREGMEAYKDAFNLNNLILDEKLIYNGKFSSESGEKIFKSMLSKIKDKKITAVLSLNNEIFYGILQGMREEKLQYPEDLSVITFEDSKLMELLDPPITVIKRPTDMIGKSVVNQLMKYIENPRSYGKLDPIVIPTKFVIRESCKKVEEEKTC